MPWEKQINTYVCQKKYKIMPWEKQINTYAKRSIKSCLWRANYHWGEIKAVHTQGCHSGHLKQWLWLYFMNCKQGWIRWWVNHGRTESPVVEGIDDQVEGVGEADGDNHKPGKPVEGSPGNNLLLCMTTEWISKQHYNHYALSKIMILITFLMKDSKAHVWWKRTKSLPWWVSPSFKQAYWCWVTLVS